MLSGDSQFSISLSEHVLMYSPKVPNVWIRPNNQRREADAAKALMTVPDGDHLTLLNVYNNYVQSMSLISSPYYGLLNSSCRLARQELDLDQLSVCPCACTS